MKLRTIVVLILFVVVAELYSLETLNYKIVYLGVDIVNVEIRHSSEKKFIDITASTDGLLSSLHELNNSFYVDYQNNFLPLKYKKHTNQKNFFENLTFDYFHQELFTTVIDSIKSEKRNYAIFPETRDFFSALYYLRYTDEKSGEIFLDARETNWKTNFTFEETEIIELHGQKYFTNRIKLNFQKLSDKEPPKSDMLTNNLVNEDNTLYFWITTDAERLPIKAKYKMKPFSVFWELESYEAN